MFFRQVFDPILAQYAYVIGCQRSGEAIVIDPQRDIDRYLEIAAEEGLRLVAATETHIHADFLSGARQLAHDHGARLYLSAEGGPDWQYEWARDGDYDLVLLHHGDTFDIGNIRFRVLHTPGHTPDHVSFLVTDGGAGADEPIGLASGDFVFVGDLGRPDLLESAAGQVGSRDPSARALFESTSQFLALGDHVQVWPGHGAGSACGKALGAVPQSTVGYERRYNAALSIRDEESFVESILSGQPEPSPYFARMKQENRTGPAILSALPNPGAVSGEELLGRAAADGVTVVDARPERDAFTSGHVPGSIHAPMGTSFPIVVGSYVEPTDEILLVIDEAELDEAVRSLVRIGHDRIGAWAPPTALVGQPGLATIEHTTFADFGAAPDPALTTVLDVRGAEEFAGLRMVGAVNVAHTRLAPRLAELDPSRPMVVHCRTGNRAASAVSFLRRRGFDVTLLDGSLEDWPERTSGTEVASGHEVPA